MGRALSVTQLLNKRRRMLEFEGEWRESLGCPEVAGTILLWGESSNGKTRFALRLAKYLTRFERVLYNSREEGDGASLSGACAAEGIEEVKGKITFVNEDLAEMIERLGKPKSPRIVFVDSLQYLGISYKEYKALRERFPGKLFVFISHAKGKEPYGSVASKVRYDAMIKIRVEGFRAFPRSRYGGGQTFTIWEEGAADYWGLYDAENND